MRDDYFREQYNIAQSSKDAFGVKTAVSLFAAILILILTLIRLPALALGIVGIVLSLLVFFICIQEFNDGIISLFRLRPSNDTFTALAVLASLINSIALIAAPEPNGTLFSSIIFFSATISMFMKYVFVKELINNLNLIKENKTYVVNTEEVKLTKRYINRVCMVNPVVNFPNVIDTTYANDPSESKGRLFVPIAGGAAVLVSAVLGFIFGFNAFAISLAALLEICASFTNEAAFVLPYIVMQRRLRKLGSVLLGYHSIESLKDIETLVVDDMDLFPMKKASMERFRFKSKEYMAEAVEYTAALLIAAKSPFCAAFLSTLDYPLDKLPKIDDWRYMKNYGILAHIYGDEVMLGNRNMLLSYDITPLSQETEASLVSTNRSILYLAVNGTVSAYIIINYGIDAKMKKAAEGVGDDFSIIVSTNDCNITETMIQKRYDLQNSKIIVLDADEIKQINRAKEIMEEEDTLPVMISTKNAIGILSSVRLAKKLSKTIDLSILTRQISIAFGLVLTTVALFIAPGTINEWWIFLFNLIWTFPILILALFKQ